MVGGLNYRDLFKRDSMVVSKYIHKFFDTALLDMELNPFP